MNARVIIALNMYDELQKSGAKLKYDDLGAMLGIPVVPTVAVRGRGIFELLNRVVEVYRGENPFARPVRISYGNSVEPSLEVLQREIIKNGGAPGGFPDRYLAIKLLEGDTTVISMLERKPGYQSLPAMANAERNRLAKAFGDVVDSVMADARYGFIAGALAETMTQGKEVKANSGGNLTSMLTHKGGLYNSLLSFIISRHLLVGSYSMNGLSQEQQLGAWQVHSFRGYSMTGVDGRGWEALLAFSQHTIPTSSLWKTPVYGTVYIGYHGQ